MEMPIIERAFVPPVIFAEDAEINGMFRLLSEKYYSDEELKKTAARCFQRTDMHHLLMRLSIEFDAVCREKNYNRNAQANITRLMLALIQEIYREPQQPAEKTPPTLLQRITSVLADMVRYPLYLFTRGFGSVNLAVSTFTSLDRSFWVPFFPHRVLSFMITLPIDLLFIATAVFQFQWFEGALFAKTLKVGSKKEIEPALKADRTTIKVVGLVNDEVIKRKEQPLTDNTPLSEVRRQLDQIARQFSLQVISKEKMYAEYKEPWQKTASRWSLNLVGGFLVCCLNAFTFKYTIAAFATSHAVSTLLPALSALLLTPAAVSILTTAMVVYGLVYYASKRAGSPDHYYQIFNLIGKKIQNFKKIWRGQNYGLKEHRDRLFNEEINEKLVTQNHVLRLVLSDEKESDCFRSTHRNLFAELRMQQKMSAVDDEADAMKVSTPGEVSPMLQRRMLSPVSDAKRSEEEFSIGNASLSSDFFGDDSRLAMDRSHNNCPDYDQVGEKATAPLMIHKGSVVRTQ